MKQKKPKRTYNIRIDEPTYKSVRKAAKLAKLPIIAYLREAFAGV